jgi:hypothetical protein
MSATWKRLCTLAIAGILATASALTLAGSLGQIIALAVGARRTWFDVDFMHPRAALVALSIQAAFLILGYVVLGRCFVRGIPPTILELLAAANPITCLVGFMLYRIVKPFDPELAYRGPLSASLVGIGFPLFLVAARLGGRLWRGSGLRGLASK